MALPNSLTQDWLNMLLASAQDCAQTMLGCTAWSARPLGRKLPEGSSGAYVPLIGEDLKLQIGIISDPDGCRSLAGAFLGTGEVAPEDVVDALCEISNVIAGGVKNRASKQHGGLKIGLPLFMEGFIHITEALEILTAEISVGETHAHLLLIHAAKNGH